MCKESKKRERGQVCMNVFMLNEFVCGWDIKREGERARARERERG